jgi:hypothetical protein
MNLDELRDFPPDAWTALEWFEKLSPGVDHGRLPPHVSLWWQYLFERGLIELGVGLAMFRLSGNGRLALHLHRQRQDSEATLITKSRKRSRPAKAMHSAARKPSGSGDGGELSDLQPYPVRLVSVSDEAVEQLRAARTDDPVSLDEEDAAILRVWEGRTSRRLTIDQITGFTELPRVSRRVVGERVADLESEGLLTRPRGQKQGYLRTAKGSDALAQYDASKPGT